MSWRKLRHRLFWGATGLCAISACAVLAVILWAILERGWTALSWEFFTKQIEGVGASGGISANLMGTGILLLTTLVVSSPLSIGIALMHSVYLQHHRHREKFTLLLYVLNGVPSILFGIFGMVVFVHWLGWGKSWLTGGILLGLMILPTVAVALIERISKLPVRYIEAAAGMGLSTSQIIRSVILPQSMSAWATGSLLGLARAAGETAPIMFVATVFSGANFPQGIKESPVLTLPYHIFVLSQDSFDPQVGARVWGTALCLMGLVMSLSALALPARLKMHEEANE